MSDQHRVGLKPPVSVADFRKDFFAKAQNENPDSGYAKA